MSKISKIRGLTLEFIPFGEIRKMDGNERIKKILDIVIDNRIVIIQGRLRVEEEARLIGDTMIMIGRVKGFKGVELAVIQPDLKSMSMGARMMRSMTNAVVGESDSLTIIGPASVVKEIKKDPRKIDLVFK